MPKISDITKFTLQDFPEHTACILWFADCNMRCKFCHNAEFLNNNCPTIDEEEVFSFLKKRVGLFDGVVLSGGECTISKDFVDFVKKIKDLNFKIKVDTNGLNIKTIEQLVKNKMVDFIALDFKAPKHKFNFITQIETSFYDNFYKTLQFLIEENNKNTIDLEVRSTIHTDLLQEEDINEMIDILDNLHYSQTYYIQNFRNDNKTTLANMENQKRLIDKTKIKQPQHFKIDYRNFF